MTQALVRRGVGTDARGIAVLNGHVHALHLQAEPGKFRATELDEVTEFFAGALQSPSNLFWVAHEASPVGYLWAEEIFRPETPFTHAERLLYIHHLAVDPTARRTGVARALCLALEREAAARHVSRLALDHWSFNSDAGDFFSAVGFAEYNVKMRKRLTGNSG